MLELLKFASSKGQSTQEQTGALHLLVTRAEQERTALQAILDLLAQRDGQVLTLARQVQDAADKMTSLTSRLDGMAERITELDGHASDIDALDARLDTLNDIAHGAERQVQDAIGAGSELQKQRHTLEQVSAQATKLQGFADTVEQRIYALEALSDQVSQKTKTLEHQQQVVEHAVVQSNRVSEMVWSMDTQLKTMSSGLERLSTAEQAIERTEKMAAEAASRLTAMAAARQDAERDLTAFKADVKQLMDALAARTAALDDRKAEFESFEARARGLQESLTRAETRMSSMAALDKQMNAVTRQAESMGRRFETGTR